MLWAVWRSGGVDVEVEEGCGLVEDGGGLGQMFLALQAVLVHLTILLPLPVVPTVAHPTSVVVLGLGYTELKPVVPSKLGLCLVLQVVASQVLEVVASQMVTNVVVVVLVVVLVRLVVRNVVVVVVLMVFLVVVAVVEI